MPAATFKVEISWQSAASGIFKLDVSQLDGGSVLDGTGVADFTGPYDNVTTDVESIHIRRGRDDVLKDIQAGECEIVLFNPTNFDYYNPNAPGGVTPINSVNPGFEPMRPVRITATYSGTSYPLFFGYIRSAVGGTATTVFAFPSQHNVVAYCPIGAANTAAYLYGHWTASAEL